MDRVRNNGIKWTPIDTKSTNFAAKMMERGSPILQTYYFLDIRWGAYQLNVNWSRNRSTLIKQVPYRYLPVQFHKRTSDLTNNWLIFAKGMKNSSVKNTARPEILLKADSTGKKFPCFKYSFVKCRYGPSLQARFQSDPEPIRIWMTTADLDEAMVPTF